MFLFHKKHKIKQLMYEPNKITSKNLNYIIYLNELETKINSSLSVLNINLSDYK